LIDPGSCESFEKCDIFLSGKEGKNFNRRNTLGISRIKNRSLTPHHGKMAVFQRSRCVKELILKVNGVIIAKLKTIDDYLLKLGTYLPVTFTDLEKDWGLQKIIERSLQVMVEAMIDIAERIIALKGGSPVANSSEAIERLKDYGIIRETDIYIKMVRFRNLLVHNYDSLDIGIVYQIITVHLSDFERFKKEILEHAKA
jgi:uncharacterized protein YutE (UPF0331/DUF86 family)